MRRILVVFLFFGISFCFGGSRIWAQKEIFIKQVEFKIDHISDISYENEYFMTMNMNKGSIYRFKITNHRDNYAGEAVIELLDADNLVLTNILGDKYFTVVNFKCNKSGFYDLLVKFRDKKLGNSIIDIMLVQ